MSLFEWSTPEQRDANQILPIIPNEIYFEIFEHIAPSAGDLSPEQITIFARLSHVCRLFANVCLPRIFERLEFSGSIFRNDTSIAFANDATQYRTSRESTLCTQLATKRPLALALAQRVNVCRFTDWTFDENGSWAVRLFSTKCLAGMLHMKHIRRLEYSNSCVDEEHWGAIAALTELDELYFDRCRFLRGPADEEPEKRIRLKVSRLQVTVCNGRRQALAAVDVRHLRTLIVDLHSWDKIDWLPQSTLTELRIYYGRFSCLADRWYINPVQEIFMDVPKSVETLWLPLFIGPTSAPGIFRGIFGDPDQRFPPLLRSLTLRVISHMPNPLECLSFVLDGFDLATGLESLRIILQGYRSPLNISFTAIRRILEQSVGTASSLRHVDIDDKALRLVDGAWSGIL